MVFGETNVYVFISEQRISRRGIYRSLNAYFRKTEFHIHKSI